MLYPLSYGGPCTDAALNVATLASNGTVPTRSTPATPP
jgi:hypothetical protein